MIELDSLPPLRDVADRHGLRARRSLGQNFLFDENLLDRIASFGGDLSNAHVIEIGPGPGGLTRAFLRAGAQRITALEKDWRCVAALQELSGIASGRLEIIEGDVLQTDLQRLSTQPPVIAGNLPFNIATEVLMQLVESGMPIDRMLLMFQKEVGHRIAAQPGSRSYGRLSVLVQWLCTVETCLDVPPEAFVPAPKVSASVLRITPRQAPLYPAAITSLRAVTKAAFGQRRKTLRNALGAAFDDPVKALEAAGIRPDLRAEKIDVEGFCALAREHQDIAGTDS
ncbi:MAG: 16S rRNA (adenine(1518)-N(6)/adenine(1519)-N(6))-dimethyltransferase RsmA [Alphaproteobacteria bacterium]|jgi:16S rRNA (adenine1518-N6/adenine1519-N6)-dimethyltransferase